MGYSPLWIDLHGSKGSSLELPAENEDSPEARPDAGPDSVEADPYAIVKAYPITVSISAAIEAGQAPSASYKVDISGFDKIRESAEPQYTAVGASNSFPLSTDVNMNSLDAHLPMVPQNNNSYTQADETGARLPGPGFGDKYSFAQGKPLTARLEKTAPKECQPVSGLLPGTPGVDLYGFQIPSSCTQNQNEVNIYAVFKCRHVNIDGFGCSSDATYGTLCSYHHKHALSEPNYSTWRDWTHYGAP
jgi:hypothetical protein